MCFEIELDVIKCNSLEEIELKTCAHKPISYTLKLENPLSTAVTFNMNCNNKNVEFENTVIVPPLTEVNNNLYRGAH